MTIEKMPRDTMFVGMQSIDTLSFDDVRVCGDLRSYREAAFYGYPFGIDMEIDVAVSGQKPHSQRADDIDPTPRFAPHVGNARLSQNRPSFLSVLNGKFHNIFLIHCLCGNAF